MPKCSRPSIINLDSRLLDLSLNYKDEVYIILCRRATSVVPSIHRQWKERLVLAVCTYMKISQKSGKLCYFGILPCNNYV